MFVLGSGLYGPGERPHERIPHSNYCILDQCDFVLWVAKVHILDQILRNRFLDNVDGPESVMVVRFTAKRRNSLGRSEPTAISSLRFQNMRKINAIATAAVKMQWGLRPVTLAPDVDEPTVGAHRITEFYPSEADPCGNIGT